MKQNIKYYELNPSQEVVKLQCTYTLFKRVINILASVTSDYIDFDVMKKAFNLAVERNDCTRLRFVKQGKELKQYFIDSYEYDNIKYFEFKTKEEQDNFIKNQSKKAIAFMKGEVLTPYFIKTYDNKYMIFMKVCHLIFDIYGLNVFIKDLFEVYKALKENKEFPECPKSFETQLQKDLIIKHDEQRNKGNYEHFAKVFSSNPEPYYAGFDGLTNKYTIKADKKGQRVGKMLFVKNDTKLYGHSFPSETCLKLVNFAKEHNVTLSNLLMYVYSVTQSRINKDAPNLLPLELCNVRGTLHERMCAGTKVQSISCYTKVDKELSFIDNLNNFVQMQNLNYRHIGFKDWDSQILIHKVYKTSIMSTYYGLSFSFIPYEKSDDYKVDFYSNGKCALPAYVAVLYDYKNNCIDVGYDCQVEMMTEKNVADFHNNVILCIDQIAENPNILVKDIKYMEMK